MKRLYAPWRIEYVVGKEKESGCIFCTKPSADEDDKNLIVHRARGAFSMMNKYPYNNGHLLVSPYRHVSDLCDLSPEENALLIQEVCRAITVIKEVMKAAGFNVGLNLGVEAGAGIEEHLHYHVVPRWRGDTNVMPVLADVRVIPEHFLETSRKLRAGFQRLFPPSEREART
jgi:ATP adenylyltransferase